MKHLGIHSLPLPFLFGQGNDMNGMRSVLQKVVILGHLPGDDIFGFLTNLNHGITEPGRDLFEGVARKIFDLHTYQSLPRFQIRWAL